MLMFGSVQIELGGAFHEHELAYENARSPNCVRPLGRTKRVVSADRRPDLRDDLQQLLRWPVR
jgi:hypothetical protein